MTSEIIVNGDPDITLGFFVPYHGYFSTLVKSGENLDSNMAFVLGQMMDGEYQIIQNGKPYEEDEPLRTVEAHGIKYEVGWDEEEDSVFMRRVE